MVDDPPRRRDSSSPFVWIAPTDEDQVESWDPLTSRSAIRLGIAGNRGPGGRVGACFYFQCQRGRVGIEDPPISRLKKASRLGGVRGAASSLASTAMNLLSAGPSGRSSTVFSWSTFVR